MRRQDLVERLTVRGAAPDFINNDGKTAAQIARDVGLEGIVDFSSENEWLGKWIFGKRQLMKIVA